MTEELEPQTAHILRERREAGLKNVEVDEPDFDDHCRDQKS